MQYNLHPIFVHFPIALLALYSVIKIVPFRKWLPSVAWKDIERALLLFGVLGAFAALATGDGARRSFLPDRSIVELHETFGTLSAWLYGALLAGEVLSVFNPKMFPKIKNEGLKSALHKLEQILTNNVFSTTVAVIALVSITVTGLLGGVMVYGNTADPLAEIVLKLFGIQ